MSVELTVAAYKGDMNALKALLDAGADVNTLANGSTPLEAAAVFDHAEAVQLLLDAGANIDKASEDGKTNPLMLAALHSNTECVRLLLARGANPNFKSAPGGMTPLHNAACCGVLEATKLLLDAGAKVNAVAFDAWTPLICAIMKYRQSGTILRSTGKVSDYYAVIETLLKAGADIDWTDEDGNSALTMAEEEQEQNLEAVVSLFKQAKATQDL